MKKRRLFGNKNRIRLAWIVILLALWELIPRLGLISPLVLPSFSKVLLGTVQGFLEGELLLQLAQSLLIIGIGLMLGSIIGLILSYLGYFYPLIDGLMDILSSMLHPLPGIALLPVIVLWFGVGFDAVLMVILHAVIWSSYLNMRLGYDSVEKSLIEAAKNNGASKWQLYHFVLLPGAREAAVTGLKIGWSRAWRGLISAEMIFGAISSLGGIGWYMFEQRAFGDTVGTYSGILIVALIGVLVEQFLFKKLAA